MEVNFEYSHQGYFISIIDKYDWEKQNDSDIAKLLGLSEEFYFNSAIEHGAYKNDYNQLFFKYKSNILSFKRWIESVIIANLLTGEK